VLATVASSVPSTPVGCTGASPGIVRSGPPGPEVALTFDDGPSVLYTPRVLSILNRLHARATFFEEGRHVAGREELMRRILRSHDEIGNHSFHHPRDPGYRELAATDRAIRKATGFTPCLFRPPYGLIDPKVTAAARRAHLKTVLWSVDSGDSHHPGAGAIVANTLSLAGPGSIVLMHDGGRHPQTVTALPRVVHGLQAQGYRLVTVSRLLGDRMIYRRAPPS
jgi:peptidoglycan/xylan/chitin deacetylase (PgdA/CDA1 family)